MFMLAGQCRSTEERCDVTVGNCFPHWGKSRSDRRVRMAFGSPSSLLVLFFFPGFGEKRRLLLRLSCYRDSPDFQRLLWLIEAKTLGQRVSGILR